MTYDAWGMPESPNKLLNNDHGNYVYATYTGHIFDTTLDIYFCEARFYDANTRTWLAMDPIKDGDNWYQYCYSNPLKYWDPTGLFGFSVYGCNKKVIIGIVDWFKENTAAGNLDWLIDLFIDAEPENGIYHIGQDYWQSIEWIGYNSLYDAIFRWATGYTGTTMDRHRFFFTANDIEYVIWMWKGDYINLGAGAEVGIYKESPVPGHWLTAPEEAMPMTLTLLNNKTGEVYYEYSPEENNWWITGFDPSHLDNQAQDLTMTVSIDFSGNKDLWEGFILGQPFTDGWIETGNMKVSYTW